MPITSLVPLSPSSKTWYRSKC